MLLLMTALLGSLLESAHQAGIRTRMTQAAETGMDSLFSMYDQGLFEEYGLLFLNEDLLERTPTDQLEQFLSWSANPNRSVLGSTPGMLSFELEDVQLDTVYYASDDQGIFLEREILELMKYQEGASLLKQLQSWLEQIGNADQAYSYVVEQNDSYEQTDWEAIAAQAGTEPEGESREEAGTEDETGPSEEKTVSNADIDAALDGSIITQVKELLTDTVLALFVEDVNALSEKKQTETAAFGVSHGIASEAGFLQDMSETILYDEYLMQYMGSYLQPSTGAGLDYELEYMIGGSQTDRENLLAVTTRLLLTRMGLNIVFLLANHSYYEEAALLADTLVGWTGIIALVAVVKLMLIAVWAFAESVLDVRALLAGKSIPFFKNQKTWVTGISDCVARVAAGEMAPESKSGIGYNMYLRMLLMMEDMEKKNLRTMNVIEWNLSSASGRKSFQFSHCIYGAEMTMTGTGRPVFWGMYAQTGQGAGGYGYSVRWSQTY
jgi:hypothetical protein